MKRFIKVAILFIALSLCISLTGCNESYNFYEDWSEAGCDIEEDNIFTAISLEEAQTKIENDETFVLVTGTSQSSSARSTIATLQQQAEYLDFEGTIYFVDATDYIDTAAKRSELKKALDLKGNYSSTSQQLVVVCYEEGRKKLDTTYSTDDYEPSQYYLADGSFNAERIAYYIFRVFLV